MVDEIRGATLRVRGLEFNPEARSVVVQGQETLLDARTATVLLTLIERLGKRVGKEELLRTAWPRQVVHENSLAKAISKLRPAIRGSGLEIAVSYGSGYTLRETEAVEREGVSTASAPGDLAPAAGAPAKSGFSIGRPVTLFAACLLAVVALYAFATLSAGYPTRSSPPILNDAPDAIATILWVDDHPSNNQLEVELFRKRKIAVHLAESTVDALHLLQMNSYRLVLSDLGRGEDRLAGLKMIQQMRQAGISVPVIIYTVQPKDPAGQEAQRRIVTAAGADLALTPKEVREKVFRRIEPAG